MKHYTIDQTAEMLGVSRNTILRLLPNLGAVDLRGGEGGKRMIRIPEAGINRYLAGCRIRGTVETPQKKGGWYIPTYDEAQKLAAKRKAAV